MSLKKLVAAFASVTALPIEVPTVRTEVVKLSGGDPIILLDAKIDPEVLVGMLYQARVRAAISQKIKRGQPDPYIQTVVIYNRNVSVEWQRAASCKELIHVLDPPAEHVRTAEQLDSLVHKILGPMAAKDFGLADFVAAKDRLAIYQAMLVLFPEQARAEALAAISAKGLSSAQIAEWACLPLELIEFALSKDWPSVAKELLDC